MDKEIVDAFLRLRCQGFEIHGVACCCVGSATPLGRASVQYNNNMLCSLMDT
jgi:hypothetical protein